MILQLLAPFMALDGLLDQIVTWVSLHFISPGITVPTLGVLIAMVICSMLLRPLLADIILVHIILLSVLLLFLIHAIAPLVALII